MTGNGNVVIEKRYKGKNETGSQADSSSFVLLWKVDNNFLSAKSVGNRGVHLE